MISRRKFLQNSGGVGLLGLAPAVAAAESLMPGMRLENTGMQLVLPINGRWDFCFDPQDKGITGKWFAAPDKVTAWKQVQVPHTWQVDPEHVEYFGSAWYRKDFYAPSDWKTKTVRAEFEAVYHSARVWLNGQPVGEHLLKGYTAFFLDLTAAVKAGAVNTLVVQVNNAFNEDMLPRGHSYDWAADGGITRPVSLHVTEPTFAERIAVTAIPDLASKRAPVSTTAVFANKSKQSVTLEASGRIREEKTATVAAHISPQQIKLKAGETRSVALADVVVNAPLLWHFDHPDLYVLELELWKDGKLVHTLSTTFGIRKIEVRKDAGFYLNGERVWIMGVERMGGSNPEYGMAEPGEWITHDHRDLKFLNCVFTRAHWQQDKRVLDYCDRHGIFIQSEVPTWGSATFKGMETHISDVIMKNGLEQLNEMIDRDRNHPCIFSWGLCNEIGGQNPPAYEFAANMLKEAKKLDPHRLCSYASNSLENTPGKDVSGLMDFVEWNEYYGSWYKGTVQDMENNLEEIHKAFPEKPIVISEYGWCRCTPDRKVGDPKKIEVLKSNDEVFRKHDYVAGLIFFCYNDYRTHVGDKGLGVLKQRVHGVVDLHGARKPSFDVLRHESGPVSSLNCWMDEGSLHITLQTREKIPAYILRDYALCWTIYADQNIPLEEGRFPLPDLKPGTRFTHTAKILTPGIEKVKVEIMRPTGFSAITKIIQES
jgi:beta-glucuronidase